MISTLLVAALMGSLPFVTYSWTHFANETTLHPNDTASNEDSWLGWGANSYNNRWASSYATVDTSNVADLHPFCRQEYPTGVSAPPLVSGGVAYYVTWSGLFIALDYTSCRVLWQTNVTNIVLSYKPVNATTLSVVRPVSRSTPVMEGNILFIGTLVNALLLAIDKRDGSLIDKVQVHKHPLAVLTQSPTFWQGRIFVGVSSVEEGAAGLIADYICCSFIGTMNAFTLQKDRFRLLWSQDMVPLGSNFSGVAIWGAQPSIDPVRNQVFIATGNVYSTPPQYDNACVEDNYNGSYTSHGNTTDPCTAPGVYQESVLAFDAATGQINWSHELTPLDAWTFACVSHSFPSNCPPVPGIDADFGMAPSFVPASEYTPFCKDTLVVGQKNGNLYALSAQTGEILWVTVTSPDGLDGGLIWGIAVDARAVYYTALNSDRSLWRLQNGTSLSNSAFGALNLTTGTFLWETPVPANDTSPVPPSIVNDALLVGTSGQYTPSGHALNFTRAKGSLISLDKTTGSIIKTWTLDDYFHGAVAVVGDLVMFGTGYNSLHTVAPGSFDIWKVGKTNTTAS